MAITKTNAATSCHIQAIVRNPEFIRDYEKLKDGTNYTEQLSVLLGSYGLHLDDFGGPGNGFALHANPLTMFTAGNLKVDAANNQFVARFDTNIKHKQLDELWELIKKNQVTNQYSSEDSLEEYYRHFYKAST